MLQRLLALALTATVVLACGADYLSWIPRSKAADPLYRFIKGGKAGYIDGTGRVVIPPTLNYSGGNYGGEFHDGLLELGTSDGRYIDRTGRVVVDPGLYRGWDFSEGLAAAMRKGENLWGFIDTSGKFAISPRFASSAKSYVYPFSDGLARIEVQGKFGYIDRSGEFAIKPDFLDGADFHEGVARIVTEGPCLYFPDGPCGIMNPQFVGGAEVSQPSCKFRYIDKTGRPISEMRFDYGRDFSEGLAPVLIGKLWGFINKRGAVVIAPKFEDAEPFASGLARVEVRGLYGYANKSGEIVIPARYMYAESFSDGFAVVGERGRYWYIDEHGNRTIPGEFEAASPFFKGLANVHLMGGGSAYIDTKGRRVFTY